jgi:hypothetical protein
MSRPCTQAGIDGISVARWRFVAARTAIAAPDAFPSVRMDSPAGYICRPAGTLLHLEVTQQKVQPAGRSALLRDLEVQTFTCKPAGIACRTEVAHGTDSTLANARFKYGA